MLKRARWKFGPEDESKARRRKAARIGGGANLFTGLHHDRSISVVTAGVSVRMGVGGRRHRRQRRTMLPRGSHWLAGYRPDPQSGLPSGRKV